MFLLAGISFAYGTWQWLYARQVQVASDARVAHILEQVDKFTTAKSVNSNPLYTAIFDGYPSAPSLFGIDFSGSFASKQSDDACVNQGQRSVCRALKSAETDPAMITDVCGLCNPR